MNHRLPILELSLGALLAVIAGLGFLDAYSTSDVLPIVIGCGVAPFVCSAILCMIRPKPHAAMATVTSAAAFVVVCTLTALAPSMGLIPSAESARALVTGLSSGWSELLASTTPVPGRGTLLVIPASVLWVSGFISAELTLRTRLVMPLLVSPILVGTVAILVSSGEAAASLILPGAFVLVAAALVTVRSANLASVHKAPDQRRVTADPRRDGALTHAPRNVALHRATTAVPAVLAIGLLSAVIGGALPFVSPDRATLLRDSYEPAKNTVTDLNPLAQVGLSDRTEDVAFTFSVDRVPATTLRFRLSVLDQFDGRQWSTSAEFADAGAELPDSGDLPRGERIVQQIELAEFDSQFLPALDRAIALEVPLDTGVQVDAVTASLAVPNPVNVLGLEYAVTSVVSDPDPAKLGGLGVATTADARRAVDLTYQLPAAAAQIKTEVMSTASTPFQQAARLQAFFKNDPSVNTSAPFEVNPEVRTTLDEAQISRFVAGVEPSDRNGPRQLFAAAFATLARAQGLPVRLVVGYEVTGDISPQMEVQVTAGQLTTWPEVAFEGVGWVPFRPYPDDDADSIPPEQLELNAAVEQATAQSQSEPGSTQGTNPNANGDGANQGSGSTSLPLVAGLLLVALLLVLPIPIFMKLRRRHRRRTTGTPAERIVGAWNESVDRLVERGLENRCLRTANEIGAESAEFGGADSEKRLTALGLAATSAIHASMEPNEVDVAAAWQLSDEWIDLMRLHESFLVRARSALSTRTFIGSGRAD